MKNNTIVLGIGNIGRQDDGLGWLFLDFLKEVGFENIDVEYRYQLQIEDAELICKYKTVIFIDATKENIKNGYYYRICEPSDKYSFSTHELVPETILFLANNLYDHDPKAFIFGIKGYEWNLEIGLSKKAKDNFNKAKKYFSALMNPSLVES
ncbi:MAG: hydrogenase maturation protease [Bacteroidota bacterium]